MSNNGHPTPEQIRARLSHPVVDADGTLAALRARVPGRDPEGGWRHRPPGSPLSKQRHPGGLVDVRRRAERAGASRRSPSGRSQRKTRAIARPACCRGSSTSDSARSASITRSSIPRPAASRASSTMPSAAAACRAFIVVTMEYFHKLTDRLPPPPSSRCTRRRGGRGARARNGARVQGRDVRQLRRVRWRRVGNADLRLRASPSGTTRSAWTARTTTIACGSDALS